MLLSNSLLVFKKSAGTAIMSKSTFKSKWLAAVFATTLFFSLAIIPNEAYAIGDAAVVAGEGTAGIPSPTLTPTVVLRVSVRVAKIHGVLSASPRAPRKRRRISLSRRLPLPRTRPPFSWLQQASSVAPAPSFK